MEAFQHWDIELFRAIHGMAPRGDAALPWRVLTDTGLFHFQLWALMIVLHREKKVHAFWIPNLSLGGYSIWAIAEEHAWTHQLPAIALLVLLTSSLKAKEAIAGIWGGSLAGIMHLAIKAVVDRDRPSLLEWAHPLENVYTTNSFPSGHAATACGIGFAIGLSLWKKNPATGALWIIWGLAVAFSRVVVGVHWPTDVLASVCLAITSVALLRLFKRI